MIDFVADVPEDWPPAKGRCLEVAGGRTKARALARFADAGHFPSWFGHNLDALADSLDEAAGDPRDGEPWWLLWRPGRRLVRDHPQDYADLVAVLAQVGEAPGRRVTVLGPDPETLSR